MHTNEQAVRIRRRRGSTRAAATPPGAVQFDAKLFERVIERPGVRDALYAVECAQAKCESIGRKLRGGSTAVTAADLAQWEGKLSAAMDGLNKLAAK